MYNTVSLVNFENMFYQSEKKYILNGADFMSKHLAKEAISAIYDDGSVDLSFVPSCECGKLSGEYYRGCKCPECDTVVGSEFVSTLTNSLWFEIPECMPPVLHPIFYLILTKWKRDDINSLLNNSIPLSKKLENYVGTGDFASGQGFKFFYENFEYIINVLTTFPENKIKTVDIIEFINRNREKLFVRHLPILDKSLHVSQRNGNMVYVDKTSQYLLPVSINLSTAEYKLTSNVNSRNRVKYADRVLWDIYKDYIGYIDKTIKEGVNKKTSIVKHHGLGTRLFWSARSVIAPKYGPHRNDEIDIPWKMFLQVFKIHIIGYFANVDMMTPVDALSRWRRAVYKYDSGVYSVFERIKKNSIDGRGIYFITGRNPTLQYGSRQMVCAVRLKKNVEDETVNYSSSIMPMPNADCDGDEMYYIALLERDTVRQMKLLKPKYTIFSQSAPAINIAVTPSKPLCVQAYNYLQDGYAKSPIGPQIQIEK